ncbi:MAG: hypothetical protein ACI9A1_001943 [Lentimonas sp.]|jgi:hypothetical protein
MKEFETTGFWVQFADSPNVLSYLEAHFQGADSLQRALLNEADGSDFSLHQWVEALVVLSQWLEVHGFTLSIEDSLGYVSCACASAGPAAALSHLPSLVHDMLQLYGCDRAVKK